MHQIEFYGSGSDVASTLTVRSSDNILQKSILRGHKSPPPPRHSASVLRWSAPRPAASSCLSAAHRDAAGMWRRCSRLSACLACLSVCLSSLALPLLLSPARYVQARTSILLETKNNAWTRRAGGGDALGMRCCTGAAESSGALCRTTWGVAAGAASFMGFFFFFFKSQSFHSFRINNVSSGKIYKVRGHFWLISVRLEEAN